MKLWANLKQQLMHVTKDAPQKRAVAQFPYISLDFEVEREMVSNHGANQPITTMHPTTQLC